MPLTPRTLAALAFAFVVALLAAASSGAPFTPPTARAQEGAIVYRDFVRVIDGDTVEIFYGNRRHGIGFVGIEVEQGNTPCGQAAAGALWGLTAGGVVLEPVDGLTFDERSREMYHAFTPDGAFIEETLVREGLARVSKRQSPYRKQLQAAERAARRDGTGCMWGGSLPSAAPQSAAPAFAPDNVPGVAANTVPAGYEDLLVAGGFPEATSFDVTPDGRFFVAEKQGRVRVVKNGAVLSTPLIDINTQVNDYWDHGLLGIAVDPSFATNGYLYLLYTYEHNSNDYAGTKTSRVTRVTVVGDVASPATMTTILGSVNGDSCADFPAGSDCLPSEGPSHGIGSARFGNDGKLYVTTGDASSFNNVDTNALRAQNLDSLAGKMIRVNPDGTGVSDNPFWNGNALHSRSKVWAYGLRNPFRFNFNPATGRPYVGDVGWESTEEINVARKGANLGWPCYEGTPQQSGYGALAQCQALYQAGGVTPPLIEWSPIGSKAAIGGDFATGYAGAEQNAYFYGDYGLGWINYVQVDANDNVVTGPVDFLDGAAGPVAIERGINGHIYYLAINSGQLRHIRATSGNRQPVAVASVNPSNGPAPLNVTLSAAGSSDPDGDPLTYSWNFGDGTPNAAGASVTHQYPNPGSYTATLTASDGRGGTGTDTVVVTSGSSAPVMTIASPQPNTKYKVGDLIQLSGSGVDPDSGALPPSSLSWEVILHHGDHLHYFLTATGATASFTVPDHGHDNYFEIILRGTDATNIVGQSTVVITPDTVPLTVESDPPGMAITVNGTTALAPWTEDVVKGSANTIFAPPAADATFLAWSDVGAQQHVVITSSPLIVKASYSAVVTFNTAVANQLLTGVFPSGQINWGAAPWFVSPPWNALTTPNLAFAGPGTSSGTFSFVTPRRLTSIDAYNGGPSSATTTLTCGANPQKQQTIPAGTLVTITTAWTQACTTVTLASSNGWDTNYDNLAHAPVLSGADSDGDTVPDASDNCPAVPNASQANADGERTSLAAWGKAFDDMTWPRSDALGDACDSDADNDGLAETGGIPCASATAPTSATNRDSDGDRVLDGAECALGSNPASAASKPSTPSAAQDTDRDLLSNSFETTLGTDPADADSDNDGLIDGVEYLYYNALPLVADSDADSCSDGREAASVNADRAVTAIDLSQVAQTFGAVGAAYIPAFDPNRDGVISAIDLSIVAVRFGAC